MAEKPKGVTKGVILSKAAREHQEKIEKEKNKPQLDKDVEEMEKAFSKMSEALSHEGKSLYWIKFFILLDLGPLIKFGQDDL